MKTRLTLATLSLVLAPALLAAQAPHPDACQDRIVPFAGRAALASPEYYLAANAAGGGRLTYFGASHSSDPAHAQFATLEAEWSELRPTVVFYEGPARGEAATAEETIRQFGESGFARFLGRRDGARIERLEPDPRAEAAHLLQRFPAEQVKLFYVLREVARLRDRRGLTPEQLQGAAAQMLQQANGMMPELAGTVGDVDALAAAYRRTWPNEGDWWTAPARWFDPGKTSAETGGVFTNEVNRASSEFRDLHMYEVIMREVRNGERVFAVVGRDHVAAQAPALRCAMEVR
ncbi:MAG TPA: hypothetical protein VFQ45_14970 [Longimicrobium sp.]|nr:hypothetical protein [Longimicrobium sp.]